MIALSKLESDNTIDNCLIHIIMSALFVKCDLDPPAIASKILCFGADGVATF